ncbi:MAG: M3 family metallopeptidase [Paracoccaceae bacterium]
MTDTVFDAAWDTPYGFPAFDRVRAEAFAPAFDRAIAAHQAEIRAIAEAPAAPDFENTIAALERAGEMLQRVATVFFTLTGSDTTDALQAIERDVKPKLAAHRSAIYTDAALWSRVKAVIAAGGLSAEDARLAEIYRRSFVYSGADLDPAGRARMREIQSRLAELQTAFAQTVLADERDWAMALSQEALAALPEVLAEAAREEAKARGMAAAGAITLSRASVEPFLASSPDRALRETAFRAWTSRGDAENWPRIAEILALRLEKARLLGFESYAAWKLEPQMAKTPARVRELLETVWVPAKAKAAEERRAIAQLAAADGIETLAPWDWRYYAERVRRDAHALDEAEIKPYLPLDGMIAAAFDVATRLFGLGFRPIRGLALHTPEARAWEVTRDGRPIGIFVGDYFARPSKRSGAWASALARQQKIQDPGLPIIVKTLNLARGTPTLLSVDDARTLFHEFGHALHGLLSDVTWPSLSGTSVAQDFVELPSQLYEHWLSLPEVLKAHARHYRTGEAMPDDLIARIRAAETVGEGFRTVEYCASALVDFEMHALTDLTGFDGPAFEADTLARLGQPAEIAMRHRSPHFQHIFATEGYAAGYYSYLWSEVLDWDAFAAFEETGDPFDRTVAARLETEILSAGGRDEPDALYEAFRGRLPGPEALLKGRGLAA